MHAYFCPFPEGCTCGFSREQERAAEVARLRALILTERQRYGEAEALLTRAAHRLNGYSAEAHTGQPSDSLAREILERLEQHKRERTASPRAQAMAAPSVTQ